MTHGTVTHLDATIAALERMAAIPGAETKSIAQAAEHIDRAKFTAMGGGFKDRPPKPYGQVIALNACVKTRADALARMPLRISTADDKILEEGPLVQLVDRPNSNQTGRAFFRETEALLCLFGRVHWWLIRDGAGRVTEVATINPLQMSPRLNEQTGELLGWHYRPYGMRTPAVSLDLDEVHTIVDKDFENPTESWNGVGARRIAAMAIAQYYKADLANESSLDNDLEPGGVFTMEGMPQPDQIKDTREQLTERHTGARNRRRFLMLYGGLKFERMASVFSEMEFSQLKFMSREDICVSLQVNPLVIGYGGREGLGSGQHIEIAQEIFWENTVLPRAEWLAEEWDEAVNSTWSGDQSLSMRDAHRKKMTTVMLRSRMVKAARARLRRSDLRFCAWFDANGIGPVQRVTLKVAESASKWFDRGIPLNQLIDAYDLPFENVPWGDTWYKPMGLVDVQEEPPTPVDDDPAGPDVDDVEEPKPQKTIVQRKLTDAQLAQLWRVWRNSWGAVEKQMRSKVSRHFDELRRQMLKRLAQALPEGKSVQRDLIAQLMFDLADANEGLLVKARPLLRIAFTLGGQQSMAEAAAAEGKAKPDTFNLDDPLAQAAMRQREIKVTGINRTVRKRLQAQLNDAVSQQESTAQIAERIRKEFNFASARARTIAMTEVGGAVEDARQQGRVQAGVPLKSWLWSRKETGRPWHQETEHLTLAEPIANEALFTLPKTGAQTPHPRGPGLTAEDAANCGCTTLARFAGDGLRDWRMFESLLCDGFDQDAQHRLLAHVMRHGFISTPGTHATTGETP